MSSIFVGKTPAGNKTDYSFQGYPHPSIIGHLKAGYYHVHSPAQVYPTGTGDDAEKGADPVPLSGSAATAWLHGDKTEVIPVNIISKMFDIHWVIVSDASEADDYEIRLYAGAAGHESEIGRIAFSRNAVQDRAAVYTPIQVAPIPKNSRVSASLASKGLSRTCKVKLYYHTYPDVS